MKDLYIIGAGGFGREVAWLIERLNASELEWNLKGFIDDNESLWNQKIGKYIVLGGLDLLKKNTGEFWVVCAVGNASVRKEIINKVSAFTGIRYATLIDPSVLLSDTVNIGEGSIICAGCIMTVDIKVGCHCIINLDCTIGHDAIIDDYVTLYPSVNVSGMVLVGECTEIGTGTHIIQGKTVGSNSIIGAGTVVIKDIPDDVTAVGNPARIVKSKKTDI